MTSSSAYGRYLVRHWFAVVARGIAATVICGSAYLVADAAWLVARRLSSASTRRGS